MISRGIWEVTIVRVDSAEVIFSPSKVPGSIGGVACGRSDEFSALFQRVHTELMAVDACRTSCVGIVSDSIRGDGQIDQ